MSRKDVIHEAVDGYFEGLATKDSIGSRSPTR